VVFKPPSAWRALRFLQSRANYYRVFRVEAISSLQDISRKYGFARLLDGDSWMLAEEIPDIDFFFSQVFIYSFGNDLQNACGTNYSKILSINTGKDIKFYYGEKDCLRFCRHVLSKILVDPSYGEWIDSQIYVRSDALAEHSKEGLASLSSFSNFKLYAIYAKHVELHRKLYEVGWLPNSIDMFYPEFTNYLKGYLGQKMPGASVEESNKAFVELTAPQRETIAQKERKDLLRLAIAISNDEFHKKLFSQPLPPQELRHFVLPEFRKLFEEHCVKYRHLVFLYHGIPANVFLYYAQAQELLASGKNFEAEMLEVESHISKTHETKLKLFEKLSIDEKHRKLFSLFGSFMASKWHRRNAQILSLFNLEPVLKEIGGRFNYSVWQVRVMLWGEVEAMLLRGALPARSELEARTQKFAFYVEKGKAQASTGSEATAFEQMVVPNATAFGDVRELKGQIGCLGKATGRVKILSRAADIEKFQQGDVLVAIATDPDIVPAMRKACAIVTEQGGVTSHAAIVSRELNIPCVIGTKIATRVLKDGDLVEVDANKGIVRKLE